MGGKEKMVMNPDRNLRTIVTLAKMQITNACFQVTRLQIVEKDQAGHQFVKKLICLFRFIRRDPSEQSLLVSTRRNERQRLFPLTMQRPELMPILSCKCTTMRTRECSFFDRRFNYARHKFISSSSLA